MPWHLVVVGVVMVVVVACEVYVGVGREQALLHTWDANHEENDIAQKGREPHRLVYTNRGLLLIHPRRNSGDKAWMNTGSATS